MAHTEYRGSLQFLDDLQVISLRCVGEHNQSKYFAAFGATDITAPETSRVIFHISVNENTQRTTVTNASAKEVVLKSSGGLTSNNQTMTFLSAISETPTGYVDEQWFAFDLTNPNQNRFHWSPHHGHCRLQTSKDIELIQSACHKKCCEIFGIPLPATVSARLIDMTSVTTPLKNVMISLATLKLYYSVFNFHQRIVPVGIPSMMARAAPLPPSLSMLADQCEQFTTKSSVCNPTTGPFPRVNR